MKTVVVKGVAGHIHPCGCGPDGGFFCADNFKLCSSLPHDTPLPACPRCDPSTAASYNATWGAGPSVQSYIHFCKMLSWGKCPSCLNWKRWYYSNGKKDAGVACASCGWTGMGEGVPDPDHPAYIGPPSSAKPPIGKPPKKEKKCGCNPCSGNLS